MSVQKLIYMPQQQHDGLPSVGENEVETSPIQFGNDWPGLFIRGGDCIDLSSCIRTICSHHTNDFDSLPLDMKISLQLIGDYSRRIDQHVIVKPAQ